MKHTRVIRCYALAFAAIAALVLPTSDSWAERMSPDQASKAEGKKAAPKGKKGKAEEKKGKAEDKKGKAEDKKAAAEAKAEAAEHKAKAAEHRAKAEEAKAAGRAKEAQEHAAKAAEHAAKAAGRVGAGAMGAGDPADKLERIKQRAGQRAQQRGARAKMLRKKAKMQAKAALRGKPMENALKQELQRHARRMARLHRIEALAAEAGNVDAVARVEILMQKEMRRHNRWISLYSKGGDPATLDNAVESTMGNAAGAGDTTASDNPAGARDDAKENATGAALE